MFVRSGLPCVSVLRGSATGMYIARESTQNVGLSAKRHLSRFPPIRRCASVRGASFATAATRLRIAIQALGVPAADELRLGDQGVELFEGLFHGLAGPSQSDVSQNESQTLFRDIPGLGHPGTTLDWF